MLILNRKRNDSIVVGNDIRITVLKISGQSIKLGIEAAGEFRVLRGELAGASSASGIGHPSNLQESA